MGTEAIWIPAVAALVAGGASYVNTTNTAKKQDNVLADSIRSQGRRNQEADKLIKDALMKQGESDPEAERTASFDKYLTQLRRSQSSATSGLNQVGGVSDRYLADAAGAAGDVARSSTEAADLMSRIDAPLRQRQNEGIAFGRLGGELGTIGMLSDSDRYLSDIRMRSISRDPWLDALSSAASSYATGGYGGGA